MIADKCPCDSGLLYASCCAPYHQTPKTPAPTPVALMRSRYSAYALGLVDYLMQTIHRDHPQFRKNTAAWREELLTYCRDTRFVGLRVLASSDAVASDTDGWVQFEATLCQEASDGEDVTLVLAETSRFVKLGQRWLYYSGETEMREG